MDEPRAGAPEQRARTPWWRRQPSMGVTLVLFLLAVVQAALAWATRTSGQGGSRMWLAVLWTAYAVGLGVTLAVRLRRGDRFRPRGYYGGWRNL